MPDPDPTDAAPEEIPFARVVSVESPPPVPPPYPQAPMNASAYGIPPNYMSGAEFFRSSKPGLITAIGVMSIVVASVSIIGSGASAFQALVKTAIASTSGMATRSAMVQSAQQAATQLPPPGPMGLAFDERQTAINVMASRQTLSNPRMAQLDELLAQGGQTILEVQPGRLTSNRARAAIQSSARGRSPKAGEQGPDIFVTPTGTVELYDANGIFRPDDHSQAPIRVRRM